VRIVTGDFTVNADADVLVVTTEIYRNQCVRSPESLHGVRCAILDEFSYSPVA
jgi:superfamily II RNA helicase